MKQYLIDELRPEDFDKIRNYLENRVKKAAIEGVYWLQIPDSLLTEIQFEHTGCRPYYFAIELEEQSLSCSLLVRTYAGIRCECISYANAEQRNWLIETIDSVMEQIGIIT